MTMEIMSSKEQELKARKLLGAYGADLISTRDRVGLGTGSTAEEFIRALALRVQNGLVITAVSSSKKSTALATSLGITCCTLAKITDLDIAVDGADQISSEGLMIKGGGGALLREKVMGLLAKRHIILATWSKLMTRFENVFLPLEIFPPAFHSLEKSLSRFGSFHLRLQQGRPSLTDNGNFIVDLTLAKFDIDWQELHGQLKKLCGVIETGIFFETTPEIYLALPNQKIERWQKGFQIEKLSDNCK